MYSPASVLTWLHFTGLSSNRSDPLQIQEDADHREECSLWQEPKTRRAPVEGMKGGNRFKAGGYLWVQKCRKNKRFLVFNIIKVNLPEVPRGGLIG